MFENFKTDVIYYNTPTDFEMEFNLCGCCRMRLLNDKCSDKKSLLLSLSRAVSRSRIIMVVAPLFSADDIASTIASAIGSRAEIIDNEQYNINSDASIKVIKNSVPLVTPEGIYGGCLIQSGPQTLILLTDNKSVRKTVMQSLIHPYIKDLLIEKSQQNEPQEAELDPEEIIIDEEGEEIAEEEEYTYPEEAEEFELMIDETEETEEEHEEEYNEGDELVIDQEEASDDDNTEYYNPEFRDLYLETAPKRNKKSKTEEEDYSYDEEYYTDIPDEKPSVFNTWFLIISLILLVTVAVLCVCIFYIPTKAGIDPSAYLKEIFDTMFK